MVERELQPAAWQILKHNLAIDGKIGSTVLRLNLSTEKDKWIVPNTGFLRDGVGLTTNTNITSKLKLSTKVNYGYRESDNLPAAGYGNQSLMYWYIFKPRVGRLKDLKYPLKRSCCSTFRITS